MSSPRIAIQIAILGRVRTPNREFRDVFKNGPNRPQGPSDAPQTQSDPLGRRKTCFPTGFAERWTHGGLSSSSYELESVRHSNREMPDFRVQATGNPDFDAAIFKRTLF